MFLDMRGQFMTRHPGSVDGISFKINACRESQLYIHDHLKSCTVDLTFNSTIVIGPTRGTCMINICKDSKIVVFCK